MPHIHKLTSVSTILNKVQRTFRPPDSSWIGDAIEDIGLAIQAIGYHAGFEHKQTEPPYIKVTNNRAKVPCHVERIKVIEQLLPDAFSERNLLNPDGTTPFPQVEYNPDCTYRGVKMFLGSDQTGYGFAEDNPRTTGISPGAPYYNLDGDYIYTSFTEGLIKLHYVGFALDKNGYPRILDDADYKMAVEWYVVYNMLLKGFKHPDLSWKDAYQMWETYRLRAENAPKMPSIDAAERFRNTWSRFAIGNEWGQEFFMNLEQPSNIE
ncbi:MAG: hypothetical protein ACK53T_01365 [Planctomycetota bacterium]|jgi:hypothetical protein